MIDENDPMAAIRAKYVRHERLPIPVLTSVARSTGCDVVKSRMQGVDYEIGHRGMCIGTIGVDDGVPYLEMSKVSSPPYLIDAINTGIAGARANRAQGMGMGAGIG